MKKIVRIIMLMIVIASLTTMSMAANVSMNLGPDKETVEQGAEVKVTIGIKDFTREGANKAIEAKLEYDVAKLEYKGIEWKDGWTGNISSDGTGLAVMKTEEVEQEELVAEITYKVKENAEKGVTTITGKEILTSADGDEVQASNVETSIEIIVKVEDGNGEKEKELTSIEITTKPSKTAYTEGEKFDKTGMKITAKYSDGSSKEITEYTYSPAGELKNTDTKITISYTENGITKTVEQEIKVTKKSEGKDKENKKDNSTSEKEYPKTGVETIVLPICLVIIIAVVSYIKYRKYKQI